MKNFKRMLALVVVVIMAFATFVGCDSEEKAEAKTITIYLENKSRGAIADYDDSPAMQEFERVLGINLEFQHPVDTSTDKVPLMIQSGDLPDVLFISTYFYGGWSKPQVKEAAYNGIFLKVDEHLDEMPNLKKYLESNPDVERTIRMYNEDNGIYGIPTVYSDASYNYYDGYFIRKDWLKKVKLGAGYEHIQKITTNADGEKVVEVFPENIKTIKDWEAVLTAFVEQDPNGNGEKDEVGFSTFAYMSKFVFMPAFDVFNWNYYLDPDDDEITHGAVEPGMKDFIKTITKWRAKGLVNSDYAVTTQETLDNLVFSDRLGAFYCDFNNTAIKYVADNDDIELVAVPMIENSRGQARTGKVGKGVVGGTTALINAKSENLDDVLNFFDFCFSEEGIAIGNWGVEGDSYTVDKDGNKHFTDKIKGDSTKVVDNYNAYTASGVNGGIVCYYDNSVNTELKASVSTAQSDLQALATQYCIDVDKCANLPSTATTIEEDEEISRLSGDLTTLLNETWTKFLNGEKSADDFDAFVEEVNSKGMSRILQIKQDGYERGVENTQDLYDKAVEMGLIEE